MVLVMFRARDWNSRREGVDSPFCSVDHPVVQLRVHVSPVRNGAESWPG